MVRLGIGEQIDNCIWHAVKMSGIPAEGLMLFVFPQVRGETAAPSTPQQETVVLMCEDWAGVYFDTFTYAGKPNGEFLFCLYRRKMPDLGLHKPLFEAGTVVSRLSGKG